MGGLFRGAADAETASIVDRLAAGNGATGRNRTDDLRFTKPLLYQLSYRGETGGNLDSNTAISAFSPLELSNTR